MAKKAVSFGQAAGVLRDVGGFLYGPEPKDKLASLLGLPPRVVNDTLKGHGGLTLKRLTELSEQRAAEAALFRDTLRLRLKRKS